MAADENEWKNLVSSWNSNAKKDMEIVKKKVIEFGKSYLPWLQSSKQKIVKEKKDYSDLLPSKCLNVLRLFQFCLFLLQQFLFFSFYGI